jgi:hypothetical protein
VYCCPVALQSSAHPGLIRACSPSPSRRRPPPVWGPSLARHRVATSCHRVRHTSGSLQVRDLEIRSELDGLEPIDLFLIRQRQPTPRPAGSEEYIVRALRKFAEPAGRGLPQGTLLHDCYLHPPELAELYVDDSYGSLVPLSSVAVRDTSGRRSPEEDAGAASGSCPTAQHRLRIQPFPTRW